MPHPSQDTPARHVAPCIFYSNMANYFWFVFLSSLFISTSMTCLSSWYHSLPPCMHSSYSISSSSRVLYLTFHISAYSYSHFPLPPMTLFLLTLSKCSTLSYPLTLAYMILRTPPTTHMMTPLTTNKPMRWLVVRSSKIGYG